MLRRPPVVAPVSSEIPDRPHGPLPAAKGIPNASSNDSDTVTGVCTWEAGRLRGSGRKGEVPGVTMWETRPAGSPSPLTHGPQHPMAAAPSGPPLH